MSDDDVSLPLSLLSPSSFPLSSFLSSLFLSFFPLILPGHRQYHRRTTQRGTVVGRHGGRGPVGAQFLPRHGLGPTGDPPRGGQSECTHRRCDVPSEVFTLSYILSHTQILKHPPFHPLLTHLPHTSSSSNTPTPPLASSLLSPLPPSPLSPPPRYYGYTDLPPGSDDSAIDTLPFPTLPRDVSAAAGLPTPLPAQWPR